MKNIILLASLVTLSSCGFRADSQNVNSNSGTGIIGGELVDEKDPLASHVVAVMNMAEGAICTGTLIGPNIVVTAAHCVYETKTSKIKIIFGVNADAVQSTLEPDILQEYTRTADRIQVHPGYGPEMQLLQEWDWNDIAVLRFRGVHPVEYKPIELLSRTSMLKVGAMVRLAGYGVSELTTEPVDPKTIDNIEEAMEYGEVLCEDDEKLTNCLKVTSTGDGELRQTQAAISEIKKTEVVLDESKGHGTCMGDSGGPAFYENEKGELYLFGITSRGGPLCNDLGVYTNAVEFKSWIESSIKKMNEKN